MKEVSTKVFNRLCRQGISIEQCYCGGWPEIVVAHPWYGGAGAKVKCEYCGDETKSHEIGMCIVDEKK